MARVNPVLICATFIGFAFFSTPGRAQNQDVTSILAGFDPQYCPNTIVRQAIQPRMAAYACQGLVITPSLCTSCPMRKFDKNGNFKNNRDIYALEGWKCQKALNLFIQKNPCDDKRRRDVTNFYKQLRTKPEKRKWWLLKRSQRDLGEFMYDMCELCCDCVPIGARLNQFKKRAQVQKKQWYGNQESLINIYRGNCPVHYYYDTCRMYPNLRDIVPPGKKPNLKKEKICPDHVYPWWFKKSNRVNWLRRKSVPGMSVELRNFLAKMTRLMKCSNGQVWKECTALERAQKRV